MSLFFWGQDILQRRQLVIEVSPFDFKYCIFICRLKVSSDRAGFVPVNILVSIQVVVG